MGWASPRTFRIGDTSLIALAHFQIRRSPRWKYANRGSSYEIRGASRLCNIIWLANMSRFNVVWGVALLSLCIVSLIEPIASVRSNYDAIQVSRNY